VAADARAVAFKVKDYRIDGPGRYKTVTLDPHELTHPTFGHPSCRFIGSLSRPRMHGNGRVAGLVFECITRWPQNARDRADARSPQQESSTCSGRAMRRGDGPAGGDLLHLLMAIFNH
jgi:hypothetical protein